MCQKISSGNLYEGTLGTGPYCSQTLCLKQMINEYINAIIPGVPKKMFIRELCALLANENFLGHPVQ